MPWLIPITCTHTVTFSLCSWQPELRAGSDRAWVIAVEAQHRYARSFGSAGSNVGTIRHVRTLRFLLISWSCCIRQLQLGQARGAPHNLRSACPK